MCVCVSVWLRLCLCSCLCVSVSVCLCVSPPLSLPPSHSLHHSLSLCLLWADTVMDGNTHQSTGLSADAATLTSTELGPGSGFSRASVNSKLSVACPLFVKTKPFIVFRLFGGGVPLNLTDDDLQCWKQQEAKQKMMHPLICSLPHPSFTPHHSHLI